MTNAARDLEPSSPLSAAGPAGTPRGDDAVQPWLRTAIFIVIVIELLGLQSSAALLADGEWPGTPVSDPAQWLASSAGIFAPLGAVAALVFAIRGSMRGAVFGLAATILMAWLGLLPSAFVGGLGLGGEETFGALFASFEVVFRLVIAPLLALAAIALAWARTRLALACGLVCLPTAFGVIGIAAFFVGVMTYGF